MEREWTEEKVNGDADPRAASAHHMGSDGPTLDQDGQAF